MDSYKFCKYCNRSYKNEFMNICDTCKFDICISCMNDEKILCKYCYDEANPFQFSEKILKRIIKKKRKKRVKVVEKEFNENCGITKEEYDKTKNILSNICEQAEYFYSQMAEDFQKIIPPPLHWIVLQNDMRKTWEDMEIKITNDNPILIYFKFMYDSFPKKYSDIIKQELEKEGEKDNVVIFHELQMSN